MVFFFNKLETFSLNFMIRKNTLDQTSKTVTRNPVKVPLTIFLAQFGT